MSGTTAPTPASEVIEKFLGALLNNLPTVLDLANQTQTAVDPKTEGANRGAAITGILGDVVNFLHQVFPGHPQLPVMPAALTNTTAAPTPPAA